jgi:DNA adenine methylase
MKSVLSVLRYPGGKSRMLGSLAPYILGMLQGEKSYGEPFVGGGSIALYVANRFPDMRLCLNDKDPLIAGLWSVIAGPQEHVDALIGLLNVQPSVRLWEAIRAFEPMDVVDRAAKAILLNRMTWSGILTATPIGGKEQRGKDKIGCRYYLSTLKQRIQQQHDLLVGRTKVTCLDALDFLKASHCPCYFDPPYLMREKTALYPVTMSQAEHRAFAAELRRLPQKWLLTYDMDDEIACDLYWGAAKTLIDTRYSIDTGLGAKVRVARWKKASEICAWKGFEPLVRK